MESFKIKCQICNTRNSKYTCPRCQIAYCTLECYKDQKHLKCTEEFYKDQVTQELLNIKPTEDESKKVMQIIKSHYENMTENDDHEYYELVEKISQIDLDSADFNTIWNVLDQRDRDEFSRLFYKGTMSNEAKEILEDATTSNVKQWWENTSKKIEIIETSSEECQTDLTTDGITTNELLEIENEDFLYNDPENDTEKFLQQPEIFKDIPPFESITKAPVNILVFNQLSGILMFQGEIENNPSESLNQIFQISPYIHGKVAPVFNSIEEVVSVGFSFLNEFKAEARLFYMEDLKKLVEYKQGCLIALSHIYRLCDIINSEQYTKDKNDSKETKKLNHKEKFRKRVDRASKRIYYFMALMKKVSIDHSSNIGSNIGNDFGFEYMFTQINIYIARTKTELEQLKDSKDIVMKLKANQSNSSKKIIEIIN
ncbi:hypothetical protein BB558_000544 [Smittium angustum]|uniref:HIT-type domain-containing protein n=1 Tax=Smittium angustum TaxID=133377 RepID=A0A2U1JE24_SMIAN|nr:hypothetical protein BB558_000544 [Smittium angustum]